MLQPRDARCTVATYSSFQPHSSDEVYLRVLETIGLTSFEQGFSTHVASHVSKLGSKRLLCSFLHHLVCCSHHRLITHTVKVPIGNGQLAGTKVLLLRWPAAPPTRRNEGSLDWWLVTNNGNGDFTDVRRPSVHTDGHFTV